MNSRILRGAAVLGAAALAATAAGCANSSSGPSAAAAPSLAPVSRLHDELPAAVRHRGTLRVVTDASYAPASSFATNGRTIVGFEPDLGAALGQVLGVKVVFSDHEFDSLPGRVTSGSADLIMSAMTDTKVRERNLDFVDYFSAGTSLVVQRGNPNGISDLTSLCGETVAVETGTIQYDLLRREQEHCGSKRIKLLTAPTNDDALVKLRTGEASALPMDYPPAELLTTAARTRSSYQLASTSQYEPGPYGIGVAKSQPGLRDAVQGALTTLMKDGEYRRVLDQWNVSSGALSTASVNAG